MDIALRSVTDQALAIARGEISSVELLDRIVERYERFNPILNAVIFERIEEARGRARAADAVTAAGGSWGPLHGVPMTIKEAWDWVGSPSTSGVVDRVDWRPQRNCEAVDRLLAGGAIIYGKTNLPVAMADWQTFNPIYGSTGNPWNSDYTPGGSSGGAAAALAAGLTALELGSDIGASIRNPAHYCGVFGHKPTFGIVPAAGHGNPGSPVTIDIGVGGPMARYATDLSVGLDVVAGAGGLDARGWDLSLPAPRTTDPRELRVAVMLEFEQCVAQDDELTEQLETTVAAIEQLGVSVDRTARPALDLESEHHAYMMLLRAATGTEATEDEYRTSLGHAERWNAGDRDYRALAGAGAAISHWEWAKFHNQREHARLAWDTFFDDVDLLLCPTAATVAYPKDETGERADRTISVNGRQEPTTDQLFWAGLSCGVYLPGTVAPAGLTRSGLPCGLQIVAGHLRDRESLAFAAFMERELGGFVTPPGYD